MSALGEELQAPLPDKALAPRTVQHPVHFYTRETSIYCEQEHVRNRDIAEEFKENKEIN